MYQTASEIHAAAEQLHAVAQRINGIRHSLRPIPSDRAWVKLWPGLGSAKTWAKIVECDFAEVRIETQLPNYLAVLAALTEEVKTRGDEELYDDIAGAQVLSLAVLRLMHHHGKDRFISVKGGNGTGKTSALTVVKNGAASGSMVVVEANDTWKSDKESYEDMLSALGDIEAEIAKCTTNGSRMKRLIAVLKRRGRIILAIDEAHHCTGRTLNILKTLLNQTEVLIVAAGIDTLISKLRAAASEEAKQLFQNRLFQSVSLSAPDADGAVKYLQRRLACEASWKASTLRVIASESAHCGGWSYLRRIVAHLSYTGAAAPTDEDLLAAAASAKFEIA